MIATRRAGDVLRSYDEWVLSSFESPVSSFQTMRKTLRIFLWMIKGVLLLIALAALILWPVYRNNYRLALAEQATARSPTSDHCTWQSYECGVWDGHLIFSYTRGRSSEPRAIEYTKMVRREYGEQWRFGTYAAWWTWTPENYEGHAGPLHWSFEVDDRPTQQQVKRKYAAPLWLVALISGAWPLTSITFALRRSIKHRRAVRKGFCQRCGYDLRATPDPAAGLLPVCPECGAKTAAASTPGPRSAG